MNKLLLILTQRYFHSCKIDCKYYFGRFKSQDFNFLFLYLNSLIYFLLLWSFANLYNVYCLFLCCRKSNCLAVDLNKTSNGVICRYSDIQPMYTVDCGVERDSSTSKVSTDYRYSDIDLIYSVDVLC